MFCLGDAKITQRGHEEAGSRPPVRKLSTQVLAEVFSGGADIGSLIRAPDGRVPRILVGDADPAIRERLHRVLSSAGCRVEEVADRRAAFAAIHAPPDLVIADAALAQRNGYALLRQLRAYSATSWLPVVLLAAEPSESEKREALEAGADDYLAKPFGARELLSRVGLHLAMARVGRDAVDVVRASEQRLAEVLEAIGEAVYATDHDERILLANRKALELWRLRPDEAIGRRLIDLFPGVEDGEPFQAYRRVLRTGRPAHLETRAPSLGDRWISLDIHRSPDGGVVVAFRDIDERKSAEARLRQSEERFRLMLETLPDIAFVLGPDGMAEYYNKQMRDYVGTPLGPAPADRSSLSPPDDREWVDRARTQGFATGTEFVIEARMRRHDGVYRWHRIRNRPVWIDGKVAFWLCTAVDIDDMREANALLERRVAERTAELEAANRRLAAQIDEREKAEAQLRQAQRIEAVGQLTSGVAHDFNNLLTAIIGNLELLEARIEEDDARLAKPLAAAVSAAERGARLTAQLLAFSRQQQMNPEPIDLNRVVSGVGPLLHSTIGATVDIDIALAPDLWPALADASQIELVLLNLAINARDAMPDGGAITLATANATTGRPERPEHPPVGEYVMVSVADTGCGIPPAILDKVFNPFFTTKEVGKGSGLGLSLVLGVSQQLGGGVRIDTTPGAGTTVKVYLPRARVREAHRRSSTQHGPPVAEGGGGGRRGCGGRVLLVDDDPDVRAVAAAMLAEAGYDVIEAGSGGAALDLLENPDLDIALMVADIVMPGMNGVELAHAVRGRHPEMPVLFVTGYGGAALPAHQPPPGEL
ncbi:MAG TPA: response regulator, partial [Stellaceae bacterium]|nr:response regulator [Stellaceae bacterium]